MTNFQQGWGAGPSARYDTLAAPFRPIFARIREQAVERDLNHRLPDEEIGWLRAANFTKLRLAPELGGQGATLPELFALLIELSEADPNVTNAVRAHFGFIEDAFNNDDENWQALWIARVAAGETVGSGYSEAGATPLGGQLTTLRRDGSQWIIDGEKYYTTGSLYADWIHASATDEDGEIRLVLVPTRAKGVTIVDDWDGFGQALTASGTARFDKVVVEESSIRPGTARFSYSTGFYQLVHLATLAGVARAASGDLARHVANRKRVYARGNSSSPASDPQVLQVVGRVRNAAYAAGAIALKAAEALQRAYDAKFDANLSEEARTLAYDLSDLEVSQAVTPVTDLVLNATTILFDALGASAAKRSHGLDRHWRNARTISSHNPRIYHDRNAGLYAVTGVIDRTQPGVGIPTDEQKAEEQKPA